MKKKTLQLFQLFIALFGLFAAFTYQGDYKTVLAVLSLILIFLFDRVETIVDQKEDDIRHSSTVNKPDQAKETTDAEHLHNLIHSKNVLVLASAFQKLARDLGLKISADQSHKTIDRLASLDSVPCQLAIKIISDVADPLRDWQKWDELKTFEHGKGSEQRTLLLASNAAGKSGEGKALFNDFSEECTSLIREEKMVAMTTLTFYKIYRLCREKNQPFANFLKLIHQHEGGVFQLEDYTKKAA